VRRRIIEFKLAECSEWKRSVSRTRSKLEAFAFVTFKVFAFLFFRPNLVLLWLFVLGLGLSPYQKHRRCNDRYLLHWNQVSQ
jgi:hypothetical protein